MKINLKGQITNLTNNEKKSFETKAIKTKNKLSYMLDNEKYVLYLPSVNKLILNRETPEINSTIYFEPQTITTSFYKIKDNDITLEINIKTNQMEITDTTIKIVYTVLDSSIEYEYKIEMSE